MSTTFTDTIRLSSMLSKLIEDKTIRDNKTFTASKLATAIKVNRSLIHRLLTGEVENPRIETLLKIVNFFRKDGFNLRFDDLVGLRSNVIDVSEQASIRDTPISLALYLMDNFNGEKIGIVRVVAPNASSGTIAIVSNKEIKPIFKAGSLFIVDTFLNPQNKNLTAVKIDDHKLEFRVYLEKHGKPPRLMSYDTEQEDIVLGPDSKCKIIGVVIRINAKT